MDIHGTSLARAVQEKVLAMERALSMSTKQMDESRADYIRRTDVVRSMHKANDTFKQNFRHFYRAHVPSTPMSFKPNLPERTRVFLHYTGAREKAIKMFSKMVFTMYFDTIECICRAGSVS